MKKTLAVMLAVLMLFACCTTSFAATIPEENAVLQREIAKIRSNFPTATIYVKDKNIHVVVNNVDEQLGLYSMSSTRDSNTSLLGGTYDNFVLPIYETVRPYVQVYLTKAYADALYLMLSNHEVYEEIIDQAALGASATVISSMLVVSMGAYVPPETVAAVIEFGWFLSLQMEADALKEAQNATANDPDIAVSDREKVSITRCTLDGGMGIFYYMPWVGNICNSYGGYTARWRNGVYDIYGLGT